MPTAPAKPGAGRRSPRRQIARLGWLTGLLVLLSCPALQAQYNLIRSQDIAVYNLDGALLINAWAGGLNTPQLSALHLNEDTLPDLLVMEKAGNRWLPFLAEAGPEGRIYRYTTDYLAGLPPVQVLGLVRDLDGDGDADVLSFRDAGLVAWINRQAQTGEWAFDAYAGGKLLRTERSGLVQDLRMTGGDVPAMADLDGDGDLDLLLADAAGAFVEYHANQSVERYGHSDSLVFTLADPCWGRFSENIADDGITLDTCAFGGRAAAPDPGRPVHVGSTMALADLDADGVLDLLLGDSGSSRIGLMRNGGSNDEALMVSHEPNWPAESVPVSLPLFAAAFVWNEAGRLVVAAAPQDRGFSNNFNSLLLYRDTASGPVPALALQERGFLQNTMLDLGEGSCPIAWDLDADGDVDLLVGSCGYRGDSGDLRARLAWLENLGGSPAAFRLADDDLGELSAAPFDLPCACPALGDLDGDGDADLLIGQENGQLLYLENRAAPGAAPDFGPPLPFYQGLDVGSFAMPALGDLDGDGLPDLLVGERNGNLNYYRNAGTAADPFFVLQNEWWGGINVSSSALNVGFSAPALLPRQDAYFDLLVGSLSGRVRLYRQVDAQTSAPFVLADSSLAGLPDGERSAPALADLDGDGWPELVLGNLAGGLMLYRGQPGLSSTQQPFVAASGALRIWPNPASDCVRLEGEPGLPNGRQGLALRVWDEQGALVHSEQGLSGPPWIWCPDLPTGQYFLQLGQGRVGPFTWLGRRR